MTLMMAEYDDCDPRIANYTIPLVHHRSFSFSFCYPLIFLRILKKYSRLSGSIGSDRAFYQNPKLYVENAISGIRDSGTEGIPQFELPVFFLFVHFWFLYFTNRANFCGGFGPHALPKRRNPLANDCGLMQVRSPNVSRVGGYMV